MTNTKALMQILISEGVPREIVFEFIEAAVETHLDEGTVEDFIRYGLVGAGIEIVSSSEVTQKVIKDRVEEILDTVNDIALSPEARELQINARKSAKEATEEHIERIVKANAKENLEGGVGDVSDVVPSTEGGAKNIGSKVQREVIDAVENGNLKLENNFQKGNYGEMKMDDYFESQGYERISLDRVTGIDDAMKQGIDGVYFNAGPPPKYVIAEAKYGSSQLSTLSDGTRQMSDDWIMGGKAQPRLDASVGKDMADEILLQGYDRILTTVDVDGSVTTTILDSFGKK